MALPYAASLSETEIAEALSPSLAAPALVYAPIPDGVDCKLGTGSVVGVDVNTVEPFPVEKLAVACIGRNSELCLGPRPELGVSI